MGSVSGKYFQTSPIPMSLDWVLLFLDCSCQLHAFSLVFSAIRASSCNPVPLFHVFFLSSCDSPSSVITFLTSPLESPSYAPLLIFKGLLQVLTLISFPSFSTVHLWTTLSRNRNVEVIIAPTIHRPAMHLLPFTFIARFLTKKFILCHFSNLGHHKARSVGVMRPEGQSLL